MKALVKEQVMNSFEPLFKVKYSLLSASVIGLTWGRAEFDSDH